MYLKHMTDAEKKIYNKNYYQRNKQYWVLWRAEHGQNGKQTGVPVAGKEHSLKGTRLSEDEIRKRKSDSYWDQYNKKAKLDYLKRNAQYEKEKWQKAREIVRQRSIEAAKEKIREKNILSGKDNMSGRGRHRDSASSDASANAIQRYKKLKALDKYPDRVSDAESWISSSEDKAKANMADAQRRAAKFSGRNKPVASLPASSAPGYSKYKNDIKPLLDQKLDALKYAANIAKEKTKEVLKSIWDLL
jgi:hypothetical protein